MAAKKKEVNRIADLGKYDERVLVYSGIMVVIISFIARYKEFRNVPAFQRDGILADTANLFTYYKLVFMCALAVVLLVLYLYRNYKFNQKLKVDYIVCYSGMIIMGALIALLFNPVGYMQVIGFFSRTNGFLAYVSLFAFITLISRYSPTEKVLEVVSIIIASFAILITLIGLFQFMGYDINNSTLVRKLMLPSYMDISAIKNSKINMAAYSIFTHYNYFSGFCSILFPLMTVLATSEGSFKKRLLFSGSAVMLLIGVVTSISQSGIFTSLVMLFLIPFAIMNRKTWIRIGAIYSIGIVLSTLLAIAFNVQTYRELGPKVFQILAKPGYLIIITTGLLVYVGTMCARKYFEKNKKFLLKYFIIGSCVLLMVGLFFLVSTVAGTHKHMLTDRGYAWTNTYELLKKNPVIGYGPDNFYYAFPQDSPDASQFSGGVAYDKPHNMFLQMYMDAGLMGCVGFVGLLLCFMLSLVKTDLFYEDSLKGSFLKGSLLVVIAYVIQGMVNDNHITVEPMLFFILAIGMGLAKETYNNESFNGKSQISHQK